MSTVPNTITPETEKANKAGSAAMRPNPLALEELVSVTGARANTGGARELFTEETVTVLVFRDGAVIRLTAAVAVGQLLFLANKRCNGEVVCQVLHTRAFGQSATYVELQFTEEKADFWGVAFTRDATNGGELSAQAHVEAAATTQADPATAIAPHDEKEVDQLKDEVEALRRQLFELRQKAAATAGRVNVAPKVETPLMPAATETAKKEPARAVVGMSLPMGKPERREPDGKDPSEDLLPKPELDFSQMPGAGARVGQAVRGGLRRATRKVEVRKVMAPGLVVLVMVLGVTLWMTKPWKYFGLRKALAVMTPVKVTKALAATPPAGKAASTATAKVESPAKSKETAAGAAEVREEKRESATGGNAGEDAHAASGGSAAEPVSKKAAGAKARNVAGAAASAALERKAAEIVVNDAPVLPAKLLKATNPVYPPDAMTNFITGDVRAEAVVEADGHVGEVKVLSGPKPLREAAVEALKQYQYAPATQGGKGVASKVTVTVKFWFNP